MSTPRGLLLDFGSVVSVSLFERHRETERNLGLTPHSLTWQGALAPETDSLWQSMLRQEISERDYWAQRARQVGEALGESGWDMATLIRRTRHADPGAAVRPAMRALIVAARARGTRVGILSNDLALFYGAEFLARTGLLEHLDAVIDATHTKVLKPDPRAYALALAALELPAGEVLFVDDLFRNIAGAVQAGLQTQLFDLRDVAGNIAAVAARLQLPLGNSP
jgi:putative hydrolase of the HAD superfamily